MSKWVIENIELIKKTYLVESYGEPAAILTAKAQAPTKVETITEVLFDITPINEYEYNKDWAPKDPDIGPDQLKDSLDWIDQASGREGNGK
jgi:hypothetical protein